jgi:hypothetical protein
MKGSADIKRHPDTRRLRMTTGVEEGLFEDAFAGALFAEHHAQAALLGVDAEAAKILKEERLVLTVCRVRGGGACRHTDQCYQAFRRSRRLSVQELGDSLPLAVRNQLGSNAECEV